MDKKSDQKRIENVGCKKHWLEKNLILNVKLNLKKIIYSFILNLLYRIKPCDRIRFVYGNYSKSHDGQVYQVGREGQFR